jgi:lipoate-protein ligase B
LNCNTELSWFDQIVPCGLAEKHVTSISKETNTITKPVDVIPNLVDSFERLFSKPLKPVRLEDVLSKQAIEDLSL